MPEPIDEFIAEFENDYYIPANRAKQVVRQKGMFNILNNQSILKIDCVVLKDDDFENNAFSRRHKVNYAGDLDVSIISREDLILSKLKWAKNTKSGRQLLDVASVIRNGFDENYVESWAKKLGIEELLQDSFALLEKNYDARHDS